jgi:hypothetical protein
VGVFFVKKKKHVASPSPIPKKQSQQQLMIAYLNDSFGAERVPRGRRDDAEPVRVLVDTLVIARDALQRPTLSPAHATRQPTPHGNLTLMST